MRETTKYIFVGCIAILILLPAVQHVFNFPVIKNSWLAGKTEPVNKPEFHLADWFNESYQNQQTAYLSFTSGYKPWLVRLNNELIFRVFKEAGNNIVIGRDNCLYSKEYIESFTGRDLVNYSSMEERTKYAKQLQMLADSAGKQCLFVMAPGKASFSPELIPPKLIPHKRGMNNYRLLKRSFDESGLKYLDLYAYFIRQKQVSPYPLFSNFGTHWSIYGGGVALDTITKYLSRFYSFPKYKIDSVEVTKKPRGTDLDLLDLMNILSHPASQPLAYVKFKSIDTPALAKSPKILVIGDSYIWTFNHSGLMQIIAGENVEYWYYGNTVYDCNLNVSGVVKDKNLKEQFNKFDIILFVFTEVSQPFFEFDKASEFVKACAPVGVDISKHQQGSSH
jgi:hypothetical protein